MAMFKRAFGGDDSDDDFPLSQTDNVRPRSASADIFQDHGRVANKRSIHDRIHGQIELEPALVAVIDTPQFQVWTLCGDFLLKKNNISALALLEAAWVWRLCLSR